MSDNVTRANVTEVEAGKFEAVVSFVNGHGVSAVKDTFEEANDWMNQQISDYEATLKQHEAVGTPGPEGTDDQPADPAPEPAPPVENVESEEQDTNHN